MAAPTPVSALVHSSTLVAAGVYLLVRYNYLVVFRGIRSAVLIIGAITMNMAGIAAMLEPDIKKIIALSTLSQLGVIFFCLGIRRRFLAFFHLISHAYFKAILFMAAGAIIHGVKDYQDFRKMGRDLINFKVIRRVILVRNLSLCGLPFMSGFYSKDMIIEIFMIGGGDLLRIILLMRGTILTVAYSCRFMLGLGVTRRQREAMRGETDTDFRIILGMLILVLPSIIGGWALGGLMSSASVIYIPL